MTGQKQWVVDVDDETFAKDVVERSRDVPVIVDFWAEWCGPCRILGPILEKLADEAAGTFLLAKVDTDRAPQLSQVFGIRSIPTVIAFRDGEPTGEFAGALPEEAVREFIEKQFPSEADNLLEQADALREREPEEAEAIFRQVLDEDATNVVASLGLAELLLSRGDAGEARAIVQRLMPASGEHAERIEQLHSQLSLGELTSDVTEEELRAKLSEDPEQGSVLMELGQLLAAQRRYPEALEALLQAAAADRELAKGPAKKLMVDIFHVIGVRSELADDYRTKLARLLY